MSIIELDDDHPLWLINEQIKGLLEGDGASEDHENVLNFLRSTGLPDDTACRMHKALVHGDSKIDTIESLKQQLTELTAQRDELTSWKQQAITVLNEIDLQEIGKVLGVGLGESVGPHILPAIKELTAQNAKVMARLEVACEVHIISQAYERIRRERVFAVDDIEYDLFAAGWKEAIECCKERG